MSRRKYLTRENFVFPSAFDALLYETGTTTIRAAKLLNRTRRTVHDWRTGHRPVPRWAFQLVYYAALDLPPLHLERLKWRRWVDLRPYFGAPVNDELFLQASSPGMSPTGPGPDGERICVANPRSPAGGTSGEHSERQVPGGGALLHKGVGGGSPQPVLDPEGPIVPTPRAERHGRASA